MTPEAWRKASTPIPNTGVKSGKLKMTFGPPAKSSPFPTTGTDAVPGGGGFPFLGGGGGGSAAPSVLGGGVFDAEGKPVSSGGGGGTAASGGGGDVGGGTLSPFNPLTVKASPSPEMGASIDAWKKRMGDIESGYNARMSSDTSQRAIDKAAGAIRSQAAGMGEMADAAGAAGGRGPGYGAAGIGDTSQMAIAKASSDIALGREKDLDAMFLGGQDALSKGYALNPYESTARLGLDQTKLGLEAWLGQLDAQTKMAVAKAQIEAQRYGNPMDWYRILLGMI